jgi:hypothetical protein
MALLVYRLRSGRRVVRGCLSGTVFGRDRLGAGEYIFSDIVADTFVRDREQMSEMDLMVTMIGPLSDGAIPGVIRYDSAKCDEQSIVRLIAAFVEFVELALDEPDVALEVHLERVGSLRTEESDSETDYLSADEGLDVARVEPRTRSY